MALEARKRRRERLIVPHQNAAEAAVVDGLSVFGATSLSEVVQFLRGGRDLARKFHRGSKKVAKASKRADTFTVITTTFAFCRCTSFAVNGCW